MPGGKSVLAVSQVAGQRVSYARKIDGASGDFGPLLRFVDERVVAAFDGEGGGFILVTSDGKRLCVLPYAADATSAEKRGCAEVAPEVVTKLGDRLALLELDTHASDPVPHGRAHRPPVDVRLRWASLAGAFDDASTPTGLRFERPLEGMDLVGAVPRQKGLDVVFYEAAPGRRTRGHAGGARFGVATLRADGTLDKASRKSVFSGDLEYGAIAGHHAPRLFAGESASVLVTRGGRNGQCEAVRILPTLGKTMTSPVGCAVDPLDLALHGEVDADRRPLFERIVGLEPRRAPWQLKADVPLVTWAQGRAFFVEGGGKGGLVWADRTRSDVGALPAPFPAKRARIAWGSFDASGEGAAFASGRLWNVDARGTLGEVAVEGDARITRALRASERGVAERRRAARIGRSLFVAHGDVLRVGAPPTLVNELAGRAHPDATALTGGEDHGLFIELASGELRVTVVEESGAQRPASSGASPVRPGFEAVARARGGAIVAGMSVADPSRVRAFVIDEAGVASASRETSLRARPGELMVHLAPLPGGGALLSDLARRRVVWLDDEGRELGAAAWPGEDNGAICIDGVPARADVPGPSPGTFVHVRELESGVCVGSEPVWAPDGTLRWFGSTVDGLDAAADVTIVSLLPPRGGTVARASGEKAAREAERPPARRRVPCPADMVSIGARYCIDRFEGSLVDEASFADLSPDYSTAPRFVEAALADWATGRATWGSVHARAFPLPFLPAVQVEGQGATPVAVSRYGVRPSGYVRGVVAEAACAAAGKRLCTRDEHRTACRGEDDRAFPYGDAYADGVCNVHRDDHPAAILHDNASLGHLDPRLNHVGALYELTGSRPACRSAWGGDAVYDLVGNLDEWVEPPKDAKRHVAEGAEKLTPGAFAGGFYSRATKNGCDSLITAHPKEYLDYSTGFRCCKDADK